MKKLILAATSAALLAGVSAPAMATSAVISGQVPEICEIDLPTTDLYFGTALNAGDSGDLGITVECNDADGATISISSAESGLEPDDVNYFLEIDYVATLSAAGMTDIVLDTATTFNDDEVTGTFPATLGSVPGNLNITLSDSAPWAGGYSDTISIDITSN